jgi:uncharacterized protein YjbI with pentapeptide repeats
MANPEHLETLRQGAEVWNNWRSKHIGVQPDLSSADLLGADLSGAYLRGACFNSADLRRTTLRRARLSDANLSGALLVGAALNGTDLRDAVLREADLTGAYLSDVDLRGADIGGALLCGAILRDANLSSAELPKADLGSANLLNADLRGVNLHGANLSKANIELANFDGANLSEADVSYVSAGGTVFGSADLRQVKGLESIVHRRPSEVSVNTIFRAEGQIPEVFLRGCGLSDWQIESAKLNQPDLSTAEIINILYRVHDLRAHQAIQISPLFISYNHTDSPFVDEMEKNLNAKGIRFWRDVHHAVAGRLERQIDRAIRHNPTVLLILSENSVQSDWVEHEARLARKLEIETKRDVLCPVALDDSWKACDWPERLREQIMEYNILDFSGWRDKDNFRRAFTRLLDGLDLFYQ